MECVFNSETDTDCYVFISRIHYPNVSLHTNCTCNVDVEGHLKPNCYFNFLLMFFTLDALEFADLIQTIKPTSFL